MGYGFILPHSQRIELSVDASPKPVNVMLMSEASGGSIVRLTGSSSEATTHTARPS